MDGQIAPQLPSKIATTREANVEPWELSLERQQPLFLQQSRISLPLGFFERGSSAKAFFTNTSTTSRLDFLITLRGSLCQRGCFLWKLIVPKSVSSVVILLRVCRSNNVSLSGRAVEWNLISVSWEQYNQALWKATWMRFCTIRHCSIAAGFKRRS